MCGLLEFPDLICFVLEFLNNRLILEFSLISNSLLKLNLE